MVVVVVVVVVVAVAVVVVVVELIVLNKYYCWQPEDVRFSPAAPKLLFLNKNKMILLRAARIRIPPRLAVCCRDSFWLILFLFILRRSWGSSTWTDQNVTFPTVKQLFTICHLWLPDVFACGLGSKDIGELRPSKSVS